MMRYEYLDPAISRDSLHPDSIYHEELALAHAFVETLKSDDRLDVCPVSSEPRYEVFFEKWGQCYAFCPKTWSVAIGYMPATDILHTYFHDSDLARLRATADYQTLLSQTRQPLWEHQVEWIEGRIQRYLGSHPVDLLDWGVKATGWSVLLQQAQSLRSYTLVEPLPPVSASPDNSDADVVCLFDVIQRSPNPARLLTEVAQRLRPGGLLLATCRSGAGFDVLTLGGASASIFPLDHLCLPSPAGMKRLIHGAGLELLELTTPGMLDVQLVRAVGRELPRNRYFQRYLIDQGDPEVHERFQIFLQQNNLSSHLRLVARKPQGDRS